jgi:hypothetical protein
MNENNTKVKELADPKAYLISLQPGIDTDELAKQTYPFADAVHCDKGPKTLQNSNECTDEEILKAIAKIIEEVDKKDLTAKAKKEEKINLTYTLRMKNCADVLYELTKGTLGPHFQELIKPDNASLKGPYGLWEAAKKPFTDMETKRGALEKAEEKLRQLKEDADRSNKVITKEKMDDIKKAEKEVETAKKAFIAALDVAAVAISQAQVADQALQQLTTKGEMRRAYTNWMKAHKQAKKGVGYCTERSAASFLPNMIVIKRGKDEVSC